MRKMFLYYLILICCMILSIIIFNFLNLFDSKYEYIMPSSFVSLFFNNLSVFGKLLLLGIFTFSLLYFILLIFNIYVLSYNIISAIKVYGFKILIVFSSYGFLEIISFVLCFFIILEFLGIFKFLFYDRNLENINNIFISKKISKIKRILFISIIFIFFSSLFEYYLGWYLFTILI